MNGEIRESREILPWEDSGHWSFSFDKSSWLALLVRGHHEDKPEIVVAHSSAVMIDVLDSPLLAAADAVTILAQIEGVLIYLDTIGTRAEDEIYKRMRLTLTAAHRRLHNRTHEIDRFHEHSPLSDHQDHHNG